MIIDIAQIIVAVVLIIVILLQRQSAGLSAAFGGGGEFYHQRRGTEKILFRATIALVILFLVLALANIAGL